MVLGRAVASGLAVLQGVVDGVHDGGVLVSDVHSENVNNIFTATNIREENRRKGKSGFRLFCWLWSALAKLAGSLALPASRTRGESDMTKVVPYFLKQIYSNKQRIVL